MEVRIAKEDGGWLKGKGDLQCRSGSDTVCRVAPLGRVREEWFLERSFLVGKAQRVLVLGLDALVPNTLERFIGEGVLPNFAKLLEKGSFTRVRPAIPAQTPSNWHTIATGATPGRHGVVQWGSHVPNEPVWEYHRAEAFNSGLCRAEYLWEAAARAGLKSVVMNYAGYPATTEAALFIDRLFRPGRSYYDISASTVYHNVPDLDTRDPIELRPAEGWQGLTGSSRPPLEFGFEVATASEGVGPNYQAAVIARGERYDTVVISPGKDTSGAVAELRPGEWSEWTRAEFDSAETGRCEGAFRFRLVELSSDGSRIRLYRTEAFPTDGRFVSDAALGRELVEEVGPYVHSAAICHLHQAGLCDMDTADELMAMEAEWWSAAAKRATDSLGASLLVLHWHNLDSMGHGFVQYIDPTGSAYDPALAEEYLELVRRYYRAADRFVGLFMEKFDDGKTAFIVISDHGMPANRKGVSLVRDFLERGWLVATDDGKGIDWQKSKVFYAQNHLWVNLEGRDPGGVVPGPEHLKLRSEVMTVMRDLKDPDTGEHVFSFVLPSEDAAMVGMWGAYIGDLVFCYAGGYRWSGPEILRTDEERAVFPSGGGNHGPMIPTFETEATSVMASMVISGAGVRAGIEIPRAEQLGIATTDVAPTVATLLGIEPPAQNEGRVLHEFLEGRHEARPERSLTETDRKLRARPASRPKGIVLQGDVTDEA